MSAAPAAGPAGDRPTLARLLAVDVETFAGRHWGQSALLSVASDRGGDDFADLFSLAAVDELVGSRGLRTPFVRMAKDGRTLPESAYTCGGGVGARIADQVNDDKVRRLVADGATLVLQGLHRTWEPVTAFSQQLAADLGHPVQVNAYITPPQNQGFADHYDVHDVFVLQVHGEKHWLIHEPVHPAPLRDEPWTERRGEVEAAARRPPVLEVTLRPGDSLYLPRGYLHAARALGGTSAHLTVGIHQWTRHHLLEGLLERAAALAARSPEVRASLPLGVRVGTAADVADEAAVVRGALERALREVPDADLAALLHGRARAAQRPEPVGALAQLAAAEAVGAATRLRLRGHLELDVTEQDGAVAVRSRAGRFRLDPEHLPALRRILQGEAHVSALHPDPGTALAAARVLVREGVAVPVEGRDVRSGP